MSAITVELWDQYKKEERKREMNAKMQALTEKQALEIKTEEMQARIAEEERQSNEAAK